MNRARGITPSRAEIRARRKQEKTAPFQVRDQLPKSVWSPMKDPAFRAVMERIDTERVFFNGKK